MGKMGIYIGRTSDTLETVAAGRNLLAAVQSAVMIHGIGKMISWPECDKDAWGGTGGGGCVRVVPCRVGGWRWWWGWCGGGGVGGGGWWRRLVEAVGGWGSWRVCVEGVRGGARGFAGGGGGCRALPHRSGKLSLRIREDARMKGSMVHGLGFAHPLPPRESITTVSFSSDVRSSDASM